MANHRITRRSFVELGTFALVVKPESILEMIAPARVPSQPTVLKSRAQYLSEAAEFEAAIRDLRAASLLPAATAAEQLRLTNIVANAGPKLDHFHSWTVAQCLADTGLVRWVTSNIRDEASARAFIERVKRNPASVSTDPAFAALNTKIATIAATVRALVEQAEYIQRLIAKMDAVSAAVTEMTSSDAECQKTWSIVTAILVVVVAVVLATVATVVTVVTAGAAELSQKYAGTGADLAYAALKSSHQRYQDCIRAASSLSGERKTRAIAACQARWLKEKSVYMV